MLAVLLVATVLRVFILLIVIPDTVASETLPACDLKANSGEGVVAIGSAPVLDARQLSTNKFTHFICLTLLFRYDDVHRF